MINILTNYITLPTTILTGLYFSFMSRFPQWKCFKKAIQYILHPSVRKTKKKFTALTAMMIVIGGNLGTGNIAGIAVALTTGGPGSIFWMFIMVFITAILKYAGTILGVEYRVFHKNEKATGGPMYYMEKGLHNKFLAGMYTIFLIISSFTVGNLAQINSIAIPFAAFHIKPIIVSFITMFILFRVLFGGLKVFVNVIHKIVPFMALLYLVLCIFILIKHYENVIPAFKMILLSGVGFKSVLGGGLGFAFSEILRVGFNRAIFATDIGLGLEAIVHSTADAHKIDGKPNSVYQGIISILSPFIVALICLLTGLVLIATNVYTSGLESSVMCFEAFKSVFYPVGPVALLVILFCFAFTTMMTWAYCAEHGVLYLFGAKYINLYKIAFTVLIPVGTLLNVRILWDLADYALMGLLVVNLFAVAILSPKVIHLTKKYVK
ncbi:MAG: alanine/glycine:cation symporter family protein [Alphaproteobacteria bacterium]